MQIKRFLREGHWPTLLSAFLFFDVCFAVWVLNGALAPFISETFGLTASQTGWMISLPIMAGALMRIPAAILAQYIGRKSTAAVILGVVGLSLVFGWFFAHSYASVLILGLALGIAGASFGIALSLGSGWYPPESKGLAMGIAGAGNSGTVLATLFGPPLAVRFGWNAVYGLALIPMALALIVLLVMAKEPPDQPRKSLKEFLGVLLERDTWVFNLMYVVSFGGFIGLASFLPTFFHTEYGVDKVRAGQFATLIVFMGSAMRVAGGYLSDRLGGFQTLKYVFVGVLGGLVLCALTESLIPMVLLLIFVFAALGAGNGSVFQLVPLRFPQSTGIVSSMVGEIGALGGAIVPNAMGWSVQATGRYSAGFLLFAVIALAALWALQNAQRRWSGVWVDANGKVLQRETERVRMVPVMDIY